MQNWLKAIFLVLSLSIAGCKAPSLPPEAKEADIQENSLWKAGAPIYASEDYQRYKESYRQAKNRLIKERGKFVWFRKYEPVQLALRNVLDEGTRLLEKVEKEKETKSSQITSQLTSCKKRINSIKKLSLITPEGKAARFFLMRAELMLHEVELMQQKGDLIAAEEKLKDIPTYIKDAESLIASPLERYGDEDVIKIWKKWVDEAISESRKKGTVAIIVSKLDRTLTVYKKGRLLGTYSIGLSRNGLSDKLHAGDYATPEGKYQIIKKLPKSKFYKAFLINYPNQEDIEKFNLAKKKGLVPAGVSIGGLIEIHGGGNDSLTDGCISIENKDMDRIFDLAVVGTPVIIVGALGNSDKLSLMRDGF